MVDESIIASLVHIKVTHINVLQVWAPTTIRKIQNISNHLVTRVANTINITLHLDLFLGSLDIKSTQNKEFSICTTFRSPKDISLVNNHLLCFNFSKNKSSDFLHVWSSSNFIYKFSSMYYLIQKSSARYLCVVIFIKSLNTIVLHETHFIQSLWNHSKRENPSFPIWLLEAYL